MEDATVRSAYYDSWAEGAAIMNGRRDGSFVVRAVLVSGAYYDVFVEHSHTFPRD